MAAISEARASAVSARHARTCATRALLLLSLCAAAQSAAGRETEADWQLVFAEEFSDESYRERWHLDGTAELAIEREGETSALKIATRASGADKRYWTSVLWCRQRFTGDVRICFRARAQSRNRSILFFNARPMPHSGHTTIFDWVRPDAPYKRYAGDPAWAMYSVGILRNDQKTCNLRYIGGTAAAALEEVSRKQFQEETVMLGYDSPFLGKPLTWFEFDLRVIGRQIVMFVDGAKVIDLVDPGNVGTPGYGWTALSGGGWLGIRNFVAKCVWVDRVRVYAKQEKSTVDPEEVADPMVGLAVIGCGRHVRLHHAAPLARLAAERSGELRLAATDPRPVRMDCARRGAGCVVALPPVPAHPGRLPSVSADAVRRTCSRQTW